MIKPAGVELRVGSLQIRREIPKTFPVGSTSVDVHAYISCRGCFQVICSTLHAMERPLLDTKSRFLAGHGRWAVGTRRLKAVCSSRRFLADAVTV